MEMAQYILAILRTAPMVVMSWGFHNAIALDNGLQFRVNGYKHRGRVRVIYDEGLDLFNVVLLDRNGNETKREDGIYLDCLVNVIDRLVEKTEDYAARVRKTYGM
jgi:hypothetical protein